jgi:hypothetical protein
MGAGAGPFAVSTWSPPVTTAVLPAALPIVLGNTTPPPATTGRGPAILGQLVLGQAVLGNTTPTTGSTLPVWAPSLVAVGRYIPTRTREVGVDNDYTGTFTTLTYPSASQVTGLIGDAAVWAETRTGTPVMPAAYPAMTVAATLWTAYHVELAYPERDADVAVYDRLLQSAEQMIAQAAAANRAAGGGGSLDSAGEVPVLVEFAGFPAAPAWADVPFL